MGTIQRTAPASLPRGWQAPRGRLLRRAVISLVKLMLVWQQRERDREILRTMSDDGLKDIGISRSAALNEGEKPFWRA